MQKDIQEIIDHVESVVVTESDWQDVVAGLSQRQINSLLPTLRMLKKQARFWRRVTVDNGVSHVTVVRGRHPNLPESEA
jgi:hypothetical protein